MSKFLEDGESQRVLEWLKGVEARNLDLLKNISKYDDVVNVQSEKRFFQRRNIMETADVSEAFETFTWM